MNASANASPWRDLSKDEKSFLLRFRKLSNEKREAFARFMARVADGELVDLAGQDLFVEVGASREEAAARIAEVAAARQPREEQS